MSPTQKTPTLYAMLRVKNEAPWIAKSLRSLFAYGIKPCNVFVLDDSSEDGTHAICERFGTNVMSTPFRGLDEARDKNFLYGRLLDEGAAQAEDWVLCIDGDEVLETGEIGTSLRSGAEKLWSAITYPDVDAYTLKIEYLWDDYDQVRVDGWLGNFWRGSLWRVGGAQQGFRQTPYGNGANLHCSNIPGGFGVVRCLGVRILHHGYIHRADRLLRVKRHQTHDQDNEERYQFLCSRVVDTKLVADLEVLA